MPEFPPEIQQLVELYFGKPESAVSEADVIEMAHSPEELAAMPELRERYEYLKKSEALAESAAYIARQRDHGIPVPEAFVRLVAHAQDILKRNEKLAKECDSLRHKLSRERAKKRTSLLPVQQRSLLRILGAVVTSPPYNFDPRLPKNTAPNKIWNLTVQNSAETDEDTILGWLREAAKELARSRDTT